MHACALRHSFSEVKPCEDATSPPHVLLINHLVPSHLSRGFKDPRSIWHRLQKLSVGMRYKKPSGWKCADSARNWKWRQWSDLGGRWHAFDIERMLLRCSRVFHACVCVCVCGRETAQRVQNSSVSQLGTFTTGNRKAWRLTPHIHTDAQSQTVAGSSPYIANVSQH